MLAYKVNLNQMSKHIAQAISELPGYSTEAAIASIRAQGATLTADKKVKNVPAVLLTTLMQQVKTRTLQAPDAPMVPKPSWILDESQPDPLREFFKNLK